MAVAAASPAWTRTAACRARRQERPWLAGLLWPRAPRVGDSGLRAIEQHKYQPGPITPLDRVIYVIWWTPVVNRVPLYVSPNTLTLVGGLAAIASCVLSLALAPTLDVYVPQWAEATSCFLIFFYQTCDAIDGMQARRTGAGSPVGELLDHGCDCVCLTALTLGYCASQQCGLGPLLFVTLCVSWCPWWLSQWEAFHTGIVRTGGSLFGITEIEFVVILIHIISAVGGPEVWKIQLFPSVSSFDLKTLCCCIQVVTSSVLSLMNVQNVLATTKTLGERLAAFRRILPLVVLISCSVLWPLTLPGLHLRQLIAAIAALYMRISTELVVVHMTLEEYPKRQPTLLPLPLLYLAGLAGLLEGALGSWVMTAYAVSCWADALLFSTDVVDEVSSHLGLQLFRVPPQKKEK